MSLVGQTPHPLASYLELRKTARKRSRKLQGGTRRCGVARQWDESVWIDLLDGRGYRVPNFSLQ